MGIDFSNPLVIVGGVAIAFVIGYLLFRLDTRVENLRRLFVKISGHLKKYGLTRLPEVLDDLAIGDKSGALSKAYQLVEDLHDPLKRHVEFAKLARAILLESLEDPERKAATLKFLADTLEQHKD